MAAEKKLLIDRLLESVEEVVKEAKKPFVRKKILKAVESAADEMDEKIVDANIAIQSLREDLVKNPEDAKRYLNKIIEQRGRINDATLTKDLLLAEKKELFG